MMGRNPAKDSGEGTRNRRAREGEDGEGEAEGEGTVSWHISIRSESEPST